MIRGTKFLEILNNLGLFIDLLLQILGNHGFLQTRFKEESRKIQINLLSLLTSEHRMLLLLWRKLTDQVLGGVGREL